jgi:hypothetical protein
MRGQRERGRLALVLLCSASFVVVFDGLRTWVAFLAAALVVVVAGQDAGG